MKRLVLYLVVLFLSARMLGAVEPPVAERAVLFLRSDSEVQPRVVMTSKKVGEEVYVVLQPEGPFSVEGMTQVDANTYRIKEPQIVLTGHFVDLQLNAMGLTSLVLEQQTELKSLACASNELHSLDLSQAPILQQLNCAANQLQTINLDENRKLITLNISSNPTLHQLNASRLQSIKTFYANACGLEFLDLSNCPDLEVLDVFKNKDLAVLKLAEHRNLQSILAGINKLDALYLGGSKNIKTLYLQENRLEQLDITDFPNLTTLEANNNNLTRISISHCPKLNKIKLHNNALTAIDLTNLPELMTIELENNQLSDLQIDANNRLNFVYIYNNKLDEPALKRFADAIGTPDNLEMNPAIDIIDSTVPTEGNVCTQEIINQLAGKKWKIFDFHGAWSERKELQPNNTAITSMGAAPQAYLAGTLLIVDQLAPSATVLYDKVGRLLMPISKNVTDLSDLPPGCYILVNGDIVTQLVR